MTGNTDEISDLKPRRHPGQGPVFRLVFDYVAADEAGQKLAEVFIHPKRFPKQINPHWRVEVEMVATHHYGYDIDYICQSSIAAVFERLDAWLEIVAPNASSRTITWRELVRLTLGAKPPTPSPYRTRQQLARQRRITPGRGYRYRDAARRRYSKAPSTSIEID